MKEACYFHATLCRYQPNAVENVVSKFRAAVPNAAARCSYDANNHIFHLACPPEIGAHADFVLAKILSELNKVQAEDTFGMHRFQESLAYDLNDDSSSTGTTDIFPQVTKIPKPLSNVQHILRNDHTDTMYEFFPLRDLPEGSVGRALAPVAGARKLLGTGMAVRALHWDASKSCWILKPARLEFPSAVSKAVDLEIIKKCSFITLKDKRPDVQGLQERNKEVDSNTSSSLDKKRIESYIDAVEKSAPPELATQPSADAANFLKRSMDGTVTTEKIGDLAKSKSDSTNSENDPSLESTRTSEIRAELQEFMGMMKHKTQEGLRYISEMSRKPQESDLKNYWGRFGRVDAFGLSADPGHQAEWERNNPGARKHKPGKYGIISRSQAISSTSSHGLNTPSTLQGPPDASGLKDFTGRSTSSTSAKVRAGFREPIEPPRPAWAKQAVVETGILIDTSVVQNEPMSIVDPQGRKHAAQWKTLWSNAKGSSDNSGDENSDNLLQHQETEDLMDFGDDTGETFVKFEDAVTSMNNFKNASSSQLADGRSSIPSHSDARSTAADDDAQSATPTEILADNTDTRDEKKYVMRQKAGKMVKNMNRRKTKATNTSAVTHRPKPELPLPSPPPAPRSSERVVAKQTYRPGEAAAAPPIPLPAASRVASLADTTRNESVASENSNEQEKPILEDEFEAYNKFVPDIARYLERIDTLPDLVGMDKYEITLRIKIGYILSYHPDRQWNQEQVSFLGFARKVKDAGEHLKSTLNPRLTTSELEISTLLRVLESDEKLFETRVEYEIHIRGYDDVCQVVRFEQRAREEFTIESPNEPLYVLHMHYPDHLHDASLFLGKSSENANPSLKENVRECLQSIRSIGDPPSFDMVVPAHAFSIPAVYIRRIFTKSVDSFQIRISEVTHMLLQSTASTTHQVMATSLSKEEMTAQQRLWWEVELVVPQLCTLADDHKEELQLWVDDIVADIDYFGSENCGPCAAVQYADEEDGQAQSWFW